MLSDLPRRYFFLIRLSLGFLVVALFFYLNLVLSWALFLLVLPKSCIFQIPWRSRMPHSLSNFPPPGSGASTANGECVVMVETKLDKVYEKMGVPVLPRHNGTPVALQSPSVYHVSIRNRLFPNSPFFLRCDFNSFISTRFLSFHHQFYEFKLKMISFLGFSFLVT